MLILPVLFRLPADNVLSALSPLLPRTIRLLLLKVPGTVRRVPPLPKLSSRRSSPDPDTDRLPLGLTDAPLRRNNRPTILFKPVSALLLAVSEASATCWFGLSINRK